MEKPIIYWIRRDFRINNNPALKFAIDTEQPIIPVFIRDEFVHSLGTAPKWRLELGLEYLAQQYNCLLYTSPSPRDRTRSRMPSSA